MLARAHIGVVFAQTTFAFVFKSMSLKHETVYNSAFYSPGGTSSIRSIYTRNQTVAISCATISIVISSLSFLLPPHSCLQFFPSFYIYFAKYAVVFPQCRSFRKHGDEPNSIINTLVRDTRAHESDDGRC